MAFFGFNPNFNTNNSNTQSHPFWDFVANMDNDFSDGGRRLHPYGRRDRPDHPQAARAPTGEEQTQEKSTYKGPSVEDETMTDADARPAKKDLADTTEKASGDKTNAQEHDRSDSSSDEDFSPWGHRCRRGGPRGMHRAGPPPFGPLGFSPFFAGLDFGADFSDWAPPHHRHGHGSRRGPRGHRHGGPPPPPGPPQHPGDYPPPPPHHAGHHHPPPPPHRAGPHPPPPPHHAGSHPPPPHHGGPRGPPPPPPEFAGLFGPFGRHQRRGGRCGRRADREVPNLPGFLSQLGGRLGIDLNAAAASLGVDLSGAAAAARSADADFVPAHDLFNLPTEHLIHVSLPGAHKEDIGLDFDGEHHTLRVGGVVYRPGIDEAVHSAIAHSGREREVGVFETKISIPGKDSEDTEVDVNNISAKLRDGILVIRVPKIEKQKDNRKRNIRIDSSPSPERTPSHSANLAVREQEQTSDFPTTELDMYDTTPAAASAADSPATEKGDAADTKVDNEKKNKETDNKHEEDYQDPPEQLPAYVPSHDGAAHGDHKDAGNDPEEEGDYVKINVD